MPGSQQHRVYQQMRARRRLRQDSTVPERLFRSVLCGRQPGGFKFRRQLLNEPSPYPSLPMSLANGEVTRVACAGGSRVGAPLRGRLGIPTGAAPPRGRQPEGETT